MGIHVCWQIGDYVKVKYASSVLGMNFFLSFHVLCLQVYVLFFCDFVHWHSSLEVPWLNVTREQFYWQKTHTLWEFLFLKEYHLYSVWIIMLSVEWAVFKMWHLEYDVQISRVSTTDYISPCVDWIWGCSRQNLTLCYCTFCSWIIQIIAIFLAHRWFSLLGNVDNLSFTWFVIQATFIDGFIYCIFFCTWKIHYCVNLFLF